MAQKRVLVFVTRSGGFPTSSFVKGSRRRWSMALRAVLLAHSSLNAFCIEIHFGIPTFQVRFHLSRPYLRSCYRDCLREALHETQSTLLMVSPLFSFLSPFKLCTRALGFLHVNADVTSMILLDFRVQG